MRILQKPIKARKGQQIEVTFSRPTHVKLLSAAEYKKYQRGKTHKYFGGWQETSPVVFEVPGDGIWHAVIEKGNFSSPVEVTGNAVLSNSNQPLASGRVPKPIIAAIPDEGPTPAISSESEADHSSSDE